MSHLIRSFALIRKSRNRRFLLLTLPYLAVFGVLWIVNLVLPHFDPSLDVPFTRETSEEGVAFRQINRSYLGPFFPAGSPLIPGLKSTYVRKAKSPNTLRVLCLGESSMFGVPFQYAATIPALVRKQLRHLYPEMDVEVVNLGASAINTNVILEMTPQFLSLEPDVVLVYTGHNEFYGPEGIGVSWIERHIPGLTPWKYRARRLPIVLALQRLIASLGGEQKGAEQNLMRQVSGGAEVALDSPEAERVFRQFEENLRGIVREFRVRGVPVILGDVSSNLMFPPFAPRPAAQHQTLEHAIALGKADEAESLIAGMLAGDSTNAFYLYWWGRINLAAGDSTAAVRILERARDHDLLKFRAPGRINDIIRRVGSEESVLVLPIDSVMRARSPRGITDTTLFCEHLHPTFAGYDLIARTYVGVIAGGRIAPLPARANVRLLPFHADSLSVPWIDLAYGAFSLRGVMSRWPFEGMPRRRDVLDGCEAWEMQLVRDIYAGKVGWTDACLRYADQARRNKKESDAVTALSALVEEYPWVSLFRYGLATALENVGRTSEAIGQYHRALALKPGFLEAGVDFAFLLIQEGQYDEARERLNPIVAAGESGTASPTLRAKSLYGLAFMAITRDSAAAALALLDESLRLAPGYQAALELRAQIKREIR